jgi:2-oxoisovalerate dehydrogenase E1 component alpha subunit
LEHSESVLTPYSGHSLTFTKREQREELSGLLKKYGQDWEPWRNELKTFEGEGKEMIGETK